MLVIAALWVLVTLCLFGAGWLLISWGRLDRDTGIGEVHPFLICAVGMVAITAVANFWAFFWPVGTAVNIVVIGAIVLGLATFRKPVAAYCQHWIRIVKATHWLVLLGIVGILIIVLMKSAAPSELQDEGAYYLPYIRWIEQHRIVPGLANVEDHLGLNSSFHVLSAFFGFAWVWRGGFYDINGLVLLLFGAWCLGALGRMLFNPRAPKTSDIVKLFCLYFLMRNMITSSAADLSNMVLGESVLILFIEKIEDYSTGEPDLRFFLIVVLALGVVTIKLSSLFLCLVPLYLGFRIYGAGKSLPLKRLALLFAFIVIPWEARFPILTGYPVYPLYQLDVLNVDWKVPRHVAERTYADVSEFAKTDAPLEESVRLANERTVREWAPVWFKRENMIDKVMALFVASSLIVLVPVGIARIRPLYSSHRDMLALYMILIVNITIWFLRNPAFRFGWAWLIVFVAVTFELVFRFLKYRRALTLVTISVLILSLAQGMLKTLQETRGHFADIMIVPTRSPMGDVYESRLGPFHVKVSASERCWGTNPPCLSERTDRRLQPRGKSVEDGFRIAQ